MTREEEFEIYLKIYEDVYQKMWGNTPNVKRGSMFMESLKYVLNTVYGVDV